MRLLNLTIAAVISLAVLAAAQERPPADLGAAQAFVFLRSNAGVADAQVVLGQVADISGFDDELIGRLKKMPLGQAPAPGDTLTIDRNDIRRRMAGWQIDAVRVALTGEKEVSVERKGRKVSGSDLTPLIDQWVVASWSDEDVRTEVMYTRLPEEMTLSDENFTLRVLDPVEPRASGSMALSVAALDGDRVLARFPVSIRLRVWKEVAVAADDLKRGTIISENDIKFSEREMTRSHDASFGSVDEVLGKRLVRMVRAGEVITSGHVENPPLVERGDEVMLVVKYNGITVGCNGKAWQKGGLGERILVRNQYGRNLTGVVQDAHTVLITQ